MQEELQQIEVSVEEIVFRSQESGFAVLQTMAGDEMLTVVGELASIEVGEQLFITGEFTEHPSFGSQFKVQAYQRKLPTTTRAIQKFLSSGAIKGIGPVLAERIVERFGEQTLEKIEQNPNCLRAVKGITPSKMDKLADEFEKLFGMRRLILFLEPYGIKPTDSVKAWMAWGIMALEMIKKNPYKLCGQEVGLPFTQIDAMAEQLSIEKTSEHRILSAFVYVLQHNAFNNGHTCVPRDGLVQLTGNLIDIPSENLQIPLDGFLERGKLCRANFGKEMIFLPEYFTAEQYIALRVSKMVSVEATDHESIEAVIDLEEERCGLTFAVLQRRAIRDAVANQLFVLTGGPGTGKTTILNAVISILEQQGISVGICAPTGRAAKRLSEVSEHKATTIHRMLGVKRKPGEEIEFIHNQEKPLSYDAILVDEMSMVDSLLFSHLLQAMKPGCKLILTGDINQLPSVSAGNVLKDLLQSDCVPSVTLKEIFRQSAQSLIITNAHMVVSGELPNLQTTDNDFFFLNRNDPEKLANTIVQLSALRLPKSYGYQPLEDIQVICPSKKTLIGTVELNKRLQKAINPKREGIPEFTYGVYTYRRGDKVMQVKNNYDIPWTKDGEDNQGIFNGDIGIIQDIQNRGGYFTIDFDGRIATYTFEMAKELELAYAITIHKSQGNEFNAVIIPVLAKDNEFYNRNLLYTGITRARQILVLVGSPQCVANMVRRVQVNYRYTGLKQFVMEEVLERDN